MTGEHTLRHTITINGPAFSKIRSRGRFGETYSEVILRVFELADKVQDEKKQ